MLSRRLAGKKINSTRVCGGIDTRQWFMMKIDTTDKTKCCGCGACVVACPQTCIRLLPDDEGFDYPVIDAGSCIDCGRCLEVCGMQNEPQLHEVKDTYAAWHLDPEIRAKSTSGGVFSAMADVIFADNGLVAGAAFVDDFKRVEHRLASSWQEAEAFRGSKYVQSQTQTCFDSIVKSLDEGRKVLFTGTPCQVASLRRLTHDHKNLSTSDIVCHGVPSPDVFNSYLREIEGKNKSRIRSYEFRKKVHGWNFPKVVIAFQNGVVQSIIPWADSFFGGFSLNVFLRPSCYHCPFAVGQRVGDITLADCWRVAASHPQYDDNLGTSLLLINTAKGCEIIGKGSNMMVAHPYDFTLACQRNHTLHAPSREFSGRATFFAKFRLNENFSQAAQEYQKPLFVVRKKAEWFFKRFLWPLLRRLQ
jgi:coenzyme F420-reducing hydrogenase beta subunit